MNTNNPLVEIIKQLPHRIVNTGTVKDDIQNILFDAEDAILMNKGACAIISGDSGSGKTVMAEKLVERFNTTYQEDENNHRAIYVRSPPNMKPLDLYRKILTALGEPGEIRGNEEEMRRRIITQFSSQNIKMVVFDEFQQVVEKLGVKSVRQHADYLKELLDEKHLFMVFAGTSRVVEILSANEQFKNRCTRVIRKEHMSVRTIEGYLTLASYLKTLQSVHKIRGTDLSQKSIVLPVQKATSGNLRRITLSLVKACQHARRNNREKLTKEDFEASWVETPEADKKIVANPFRRQLSVLKKDLEVEYDI